MTDLEKLLRDYLKDPNLIDPDIKFVIKEFFNYAYEQGYVKATIDWKKQEEKSRIFYIDIKPFLENLKKEFNKKKL
jgi:hypothetical protein